MSFASRFSQKLQESLHVRQELRQQRLAICNQCPELSKFRQCKKCGCLVDTKTYLKSSSCPINKW